VQGNDWYKVHQETIHQLLVVILSYYQKVYPLSDLKKVMTDLLAQEVIEIPEPSLVWTNDFLCTHTKGYYDADRLDIVNIMEKLLVSTWKMLR
jgi:hypothetical protein